MKQFGTFQSYDTRKGYGSVKPETGGDALRFYRSGVRWVKAPAADQRLSYDLGETDEGNAIALNLRAV